MKDSLEYYKLQDSTNRDIYNNNNRINETDSRENIETTLETAEKNGLDVLEEGQRTIDIIETESGLDIASISSVRDSIFLSEKLTTIQNKVYIALSRFKSFFIDNQGSRDKSELFQGEFSAEEEIKRIIKAPKDERAKLIADIKEKLAAQQEGLAKIQTNLITEIKKSPDAPISELYDKFVEEASPLGINYSQKDLALRSLRAYSERRQIIKELKDKFPDIDNLFETLFGKKPVGKIELKEGPITLYFKCYNFEDYCQIYYCQDSEILAKLSDSNFGTFYKGQASLSGGINISEPGPVSEPRLKGVITAEKSRRGNSEKKSQDVFNHEEQHSINKLFEENYRERNVIDRLHEAKSDEDLKLALINLIVYRREYVADKRGKDELLAYSKAGSKNIRDTKKKLTDRSVYALYDYMAPASSFSPMITDDDNSGKLIKAKIMLNSEHPNLHLGPLRQKYFVDKYENVLRSGLESLKKMEKMGYSKDDTIAMLTHEPLEKWPKVVNRLKEAAQSLNF